MAAARREVHHLQQFGGAAFDLRTRTAADKPRNADVLESREFGQQVVELEDEADTFVAEAGQRLVAQRKGVLSVDLDTARVGARKRADDLQQRSLARAAGADDRDDFAFGDVERDALEHFEVAETLVYVGNFYHAVAMVICGSVRMRRRA